MRFKASYVPLYFRSACVCLLAAIRRDLTSRMGYVRIVAPSLASALIKKNSPAPGLLGGAPVRCDKESALVLGNSTDGVVRCKHWSTESIHIAGLQTAPPNNWRVKQVMIDCSMHPDCLCSYMTASKSQANTLFTTHLQRAAHLAACKENPQDTFAYHCGSRTGLVTDMKAEEGGWCLSSLCTIHKGQAKIQCTICQMTVLGDPTEPGKNAVLLTSSCKLVSPGMMRYGGIPSLMPQTVARVNKRF